MTWSLALLPSGWSLAHSLLVLVYLLAARYHYPEWGSAFAIGALSHAIGDVLPTLIYDEYAYTTWLLWLLLPTPPHDEYDRTILGHFLTIEPTTLVAFEFLLVIVILAIW